MTQTNGSPGFPERFSVLREKYLDPFVIFRKIS